MFYKNNSIQAIKAQYEEDNQSLNTQTIKTGSFVQLSVGGGWCSKPYFVFKKSNEMDVDVGQRRMNTIMSACLTAFSAECSTVLTSSSSVSRAALSSVEMSEITHVTCDVIRLPTVLDCSSHLSHSASSGWFQCVESIYKFCILSPWESLSHAAGVWSSCLLSSVSKVLHESPAAS